MKTFISHLKQYWQVYFALVSIACMPSIAFGIEPIATIGQRPPEKHAFLTDQTILRIPYFSGNIQIVDRDTGEIFDEFGGIRPKGSDVVFSPNATHLAIIDNSGNSKTTVKIWDANVRKIISEWESESFISDDAVFNPAAPLFAASIENEIYLWNWQNGELIGKMIGKRRQHEECYVKIVKRENGVSTSKSCSTSLRAHEMVFTPDGKHLIVASKRPDIEMWNVETRQLVGHFEGHTGNWVDGVAISPNGMYLASFENESNFVYVWDIATRQLLWREPIDSTEISDMVFTANSQHLYVTHHNVYIWDVKSGQQIDSFGNDYPGLRQTILSPDGKTMLLQYDGSYLGGGVVALWDTETKQQLKVFANFTGRDTARLSPDGKTMLTIETSFIKVWDIPSQQVRYVIPADYSGTFYFEKSVAISPDSKRIAYSKYHGIEISSLHSGKLEAQYPHFVGSLEDATFSSSGRWLTIVGSFGYLFHFDVSDPEEIRRVTIDYQLENKSNFYRVAFSENDEYMAATAQSGKHNNYQYWILLWKRVGNNFEFQYKWEISEPEHNIFSYPTLAFAFTEDDTTVLAASGKVDTQIWKILPQNAQLINTLSGAGAPIHFSPDKKYLFTDRYRELQIWDWQTSRPPIEYPSIPYYQGISQDGSVLISMDKIGRYLIWDTENIFTSLPYPVEPKGKKIVTLGQIKRNQLLQNYPNPFNPETWIPFKLAYQSSVTIRIYTSTGKLVRSLSPGIMSAGDYSSQSKAVHWDGRNDAGEPVSSGIYLYTIDAGDFSATRKMLIKK